MILDSLKAKFSLSHTAESVYWEDRRGLSLLDVIIGVALMVTLFVAVFGLLQMSLQIIRDSQARAGANALLQDRMEYIRSLSYEAVGTEGGIPAGNLKSTETLTFNEVDYERRTFVQYYDSPEDGKGDDDENGVTEDFKRVTVTVKWNSDNGDDAISSASYLVPDGVESAEEGGTLEIQVFDAEGDPVADAEVTIKNSSTSPEIDTTTYTDADGTTAFPGAPASSNYEVLVTKSNYSTAKTYRQTDENQEPDPGTLTVASSTVTTASFPIDVLSTLRVRTVSPPKSATSSFSFTDRSGILDSENIAVATSSLTASSSATSAWAVVGPAGTSSTESFRQATFSASGDVLMRVVASSSPYDPLSNSEVPGNDTGFSSSPIDLSAVSTSTNQLAVRSDISTSSALEDLAVSFTAAPMSRANVDLLVRGEKEIGTDPDGNPIYKTEFATSTDTLGERVLEDMEWDTYHFQATETDRRIAKSCPPTPLALAPATSTTQTLTVADIGGETNDTLTVKVRDSGGDLVTDAEVEITGPSTRDDETGDCGQAFFRDLTEGDYTVEAQKDTQTASTTNVSVAERTDVSLTLEN
jgi:hypothetical protein